MQVRAKCAILARNYVLLPLQAAYSIILPLSLLCMTAIKACFGAGIKLAMNSEPALNVFGFDVAISKT
jgi:hypothetical protein